MEKSFANLAIPILSEKDIVASIKEDLLKVGETYTKAAAVYGLLAKGKNPDEPLVDWGNDIESVLSDLGSNLKYNFALLAYTKAKAAGKQDTPAEQLLDTIKLSHIRPWSRINYIDPASQVEKQGMIAQVSSNYITVRDVSGATSSDFTISWDKWGRKWVYNGRPITVISIF